MSAFEPEDIAAPTTSNTPSKHEMGHFWSTINWKSVLGGSKIAPRMFMRSGLIRKDLLPNYVAPPHHPQTAVLRTVADLSAFFATPANTDNKQQYVVKYSDSSNAFGLNFVDCGTAEARDKGVEKVAGEMEKDGSVRVVQEYIKPMLIPLPTGSHKFHLRLLVLVVGDMDVYMYDEVRVLIAPQPYSQPLHVDGQAVGLRDMRGDDEMTDCEADDVRVTDTLHAHVTNRSFNKEHPLYDEKVHNVALHECEALGCGDGECDAVAGDGVWDQMKRIVGTLFRNLGADKKKFLSLRNTYELFGLDFLVDENQKVSVLEANPEPSMGMFGVKRSDVEGDDGEDLLRTGPNDSFVKAYSLDTDKALKKMKAMLRAAKQEQAAGVKENEVFKAMGEEELD